MDHRLVVEYVSVGLGLFWHLIGPTLIEYIHVIFTKKYSEQWHLQSCCFVILYVCIESQSNHSDMDVEQDILITCGFPIGFNV